jgi:plasmid stabilization system protein ParE
MSQVIYTDEAKRDLVRFANFLIENDAREQAQAVTSLILSSTSRLKEFPLIGKIYLIDNKEFRELKIKYGSSGYACLYSFDPLTDIVLIHAFRHQRELGYTAS